MSEHADDNTETGQKAPDPEALIGAVIAGRYKITQTIGSGGMGHVYLAEQVGLDRSVVVKVLKAEAAVPEAEARFKREAKTLSRLEHPNVVGIHDFGVEGSLHYLVMEYIEGRTLAWFLRKTGPLPLVVFVRVAMQMLEAVGEAHRAGLVHRDLKPSNIMLCRRGDNPLHVKVLDFGLSKLTDAGAGEGGNLTRAQYVLGSAGYMAPEQIKGLPVDQRADVYALGVMFYRMLTGKRAFDGQDQMAVLYQHVHSEVPALADNLPEGHDIPPAIQHLIEQCMAKDPAGRPASAGDTAVMLRAALPSSAILRSPLGAIPEFSKSQAHSNEWLADRSQEWASKRTAPGVPRRSTTGVSGTVSTGAMNTGSNPSGNDNSTKILIAVLGVAGLLLIAAIGITGIALQQMNTQPVAAVEAEPVAAEANPLGLALRTDGLAALEKGDYDTAVAKLTEALKYDPDKTGDTTDLLKIAMDMREAAKAAPPVAVAAAPVPEPEPEPVSAKADPKKPAPKKPDPKKPAAVEAAPTPEPVAAPTPAPAATGTLLVTSNPGGLKFEIEGVGGGTTPSRIQAPAGTVRITFYRDGSPLETRVETVAANGVRVVDFKVPAPAAPAATPATTTAPAATTATTTATTTTSGTSTPAATTPTVTPKPPVAATTTTTTTPSPAAKYGEIQIESPNVYGEVWVNGVKVGYPPIVAKKIPAGSATIEVRVGGTARRSKVIEVLPDQRITVRL